jgi:hypothetical protein
MPLADVLDAERNPKDHDEPLITASVSRFGFIEPIVLDERTGRLVAGHGRITELRRSEAEGEDLPDGITLGGDGRWLAPVVRGWASKDDDEALAAGIALNRGTERGAWKYDELFDALNDLAHIESGLGLVGVGFSDEELDDVLARAQEDIVAYEDESSWSGVEGAHAEPSLDERVASYGRKGIRSLVLDYPMAEFDELVANASRLRRERKVETNAELVGSLIRDAVKVLDPVTVDAEASEG